MSSDKEILESEKADKVGLQHDTVDEHELIADESDTDHVDLSELNKEELLRELERYQPEGNLVRSSSFLKNLKAHFDEIIEAERSEALSIFIKNGGAEEDFSFKKDSVVVNFEKLYTKFRSELNDKLSSLEQDKEKNFKIKVGILERLRELTSGEETSTSLASFKDLQNEWKNIGPVPSAHAKELWANYNALVEMFYNNRSIYFELKELDRKKNLESKIEVVEKAENLQGSTNVIEAIKELKKLHDEYKSIGPVPKEEQENLWNRLKAASDSIYKRRNEEVSEFRKVQELNLIEKQKLIEQAKVYADFNTEEINLWKDKTKEILELQELWKKTGAVPHEKTKDISKEFWTAYKSFFKKKESFFKELEHTKKENLQKKIQLCERAEELKDNEDIESTANELKRLQSDWQKIGPVPIKDKDEVFKRFKAACDHFFNRKREQFAETEKEYEANLIGKQKIISEIEQLAEKKDHDADAIRTLQESFNSIGFVPKKDIKDIKEKYKNAVEKYLKNLQGEGVEKDKIKLELEVSAIKNTPNSWKKLNKKEGDIIRKINQLKSDIQSLTTNIEFLASSPKAIKLKEQVQERIVAANEELDELQEQLRIIRDSK